jgi:hypothetical protein
VFAPGETQQTVAVPILGDTVYEPDETFLVCLTNAAHATLARACGVGTILDDDTAPPANLPPTVAITTPTNSQVFVTPPGLVPIEALAQDIDGIVARVEFFAGPTFLGADTNAPFTVLWTNTVPGGYVLTAVATDDDGATGTSAPVSIIIRSCTPVLDATPLQSLIRCVCDEAIFSTTISSPDPVRIVWRANGTVIPGETNNTLILQGLKPFHAGLYTVEISNACAFVSRSATLSLKGAGNLNPVPFTNSATITINLSGPAAPYPSALLVECLPGQTPRCHPGWLRP